MGKNILRDAVLPEAVYALKEQPVNGALFFPTAEHMRLESSHYRWEQQLT